MATENICGLKREDFMTTVQGKQTDLYVLRNANGAEIAVTNFGGAIAAIMVPDKDGNMANVIQGHDNINDYINTTEPFLSTLIGRFGNRIKEGKFVLNGKEYNVALNDGPNHLHGGPTGYHARVWDALQMNDSTLVLNYVSSYGEEGFSGEVHVTVVYTWTNDNELILEYLATTNKKTIINLTHHAFFSLSGIAKPTPTIEDWDLELNADFYLPIDAVSIPTGEILKVDGTPFDFRKPKKIGLEINADNEQIKNGSGYDHNFVLRKGEAMGAAASVWHEESGRYMEVITDQPAIQLYTACTLDLKGGKEGADYPNFSGFCLETQHCPDDPNHPNFPGTTVLRPGEKYDTTTIYAFRADE